MTAIGALCLAGRKVLITGASRGIGAEIARAAVRSGAEVALLARDVEQLDAVRTELLACARGKVVAVRADLSKRESLPHAVAAAAESLGGLDGLVNNAGMNRPMKLFLDVTDDQFRNISEVSLLGAVEVVRQALPFIQRQGGGSIVNVASMAGKMAVPAWSAYCTAKHGLLGFSKVIAHEYAADAIRSNAVCPGFVNTAMLSDADLTEWATAFGMSRRELVREVILKRSPQHRFVEAANVANTVVFLLSSAADDITGQSINVSAGIDE